MTTMESREIKTPMRLRGNGGNPTSNPSTCCIPCFHVSPFRMQVWETPALSPLFPPLFSLLSSMALLAPKAPRFLHALISLLLSSPLPSPKLPLLFILLFSRVPEAGPAIVDGFAREIEHHFSEQLLQILSHVITLFDPSIPAVLRIWRVVFDEVFDSHLSSLVRKTARFRTCMYGAR